MPVEVPPEESVSKASVEQGKHTIAKTGSSAANTIYTCPMHPEVQQDHPGNCPKCGMTLEPKMAKAGTGDEEGAELRDMTRRRPGVSRVYSGVGSLGPSAGQVAMGQ
jgi:hypothetical protein